MFLNNKLICLCEIALLPWEPIMQFKNTGSVPTKIFISQQHHILEQQIWYQINLQI